jgi:hypothetical protein
MDNDDQIEPRIYRRCGNALPSEVLQHDKYGIVAKYRVRVDFSIRHSMQFV